MRKIEVEQGTIDWHNERFGCITGTRIQNAVGAKWDAKKKAWSLGNTKIQDTLMAEILSERMSENEVNDFTSAAMDRGNELEPFAIKAASEETGMEYTTCGMLTNDIEHFKFSPDAIFEQDGVVVGGLETKCPSGKKHIEYVLDGAIPREYFWQVLGPMILSNEVKWWDFCTYDDRNYERPIMVVRCYRDDHIKLIEEAREQIKEFLAHVEDVHMGLSF